MKLSKPELEAVIAASSRTHVPFNKLALSAELQSRPADGNDGDSLAELATSIHAVGLLHNLVVMRGAKDRYEVCAGGRRWRAMGKLVVEGRWPENQPVPVLVVPQEQALLASLVENVQREAMHPLDEFEAFAKLTAQGRSVEDVAAVFGVTPLVVRRRLKLAAVAPALLAEYRAGRIGLDCLMVLATVDDHERQQALWQQLPEWGRSADPLRRLLARAEVESDRDPVARFVGLAAYEAAGGAVRRDLFSDDDKAWMLDPALLEKLAVDKLQTVAEAARAEGWRWVDVRPRHVYADYARHGELRCLRREPTEEEAAAEASLQARIESIREQMEVMSEAAGEADEEAYARLEAEEQALQMQLSMREDARTGYAPEALGWAGCVVYVGPQAAPEVRRGLIRPDDRAAFEAARARAADAVGSGASRAPSREAPPAARPVHSDRLMRRLTANRVAAIQAELLERPDVALAVLTAHIAAVLLRGPHHASGSGRQALTVSASDTHDALRREGEDVAASAAWKAVDGVRAEWDAALPQDGGELLAWMLAQDREVVLRLLALLVASTVTGVDGVERDDQVTDGLARALGLDMRRWWEATAQSYLAQVSKARILEVVTEGAGAAAAAALARLKKEDVVAGAERVLAGKGWLPRCLRTLPAGNATEAGQGATRPAA